MTGILGQVLLGEFVLGLAQSSVTIIPVSDTDTCNVSLTEIPGVIFHLSDTDTLNVQLNETTLISQVSLPNNFLAVPGLSQLGLYLLGKDQTVTPVPATLISGSDTLNVNLIESRIITTSALLPDTCNVSLTESGSVQIVIGKSDNDLLNVGLIEVGLVSITLLTITTNDTLNVSLNEISSVVNPGNHGRVTTLFDETLVDGDPNGLVTTLFDESLVIQSSFGRTTTLFAETMLNGVSDGRCTTLFAEAIVNGVAAGRCTTLFVEILCAVTRFHLFDTCDIQLIESSNPIRVQISSSDTLNVVLDDIHQPYIIDVFPNPIPELQPNVIMTVIGMGFEPPHSPGSRIVFNGIIESTSFISPTEIQTTLPPGDIKPVGPASVSVINPDGGQSNSLSVSIESKPRACRLGDLSAGHYPWPPRPNDAASTDVFVNNKGWHRQGDHWAIHCAPPCHDGTLLSGSSTVIVNNKQAGRNGDPINCPSTPLDFADEASPDVFAGG
jgi:uncharacterized Zn-binding protein involved in type VI secretion